MAGTTECTLVLHGMAVIGPHNVSVLYKRPFRQYNATPATHHRGIHGFCRELAQLHGTYECVGDEAISAESPTVLCRVAYTYAQQKVQTANVLL